MSTRHRSFLLLVTTSGGKVMNSDYPSVHVCFIYLHLRLFSRIAGNKARSRTLSENGPTTPNQQAYTSPRSQHSDDGVFQRHIDRAPPGIPVENPTPPPLPGLGGFYFDRLHLGGISSRNGVPFFSEEGRNWVKARAGILPALQNLPSGGLQEGIHRQQYLVKIEGTWELPDQSMVKTYYRIFFESNLRNVFYIIDDASFTGIVDKAYDPGRDSESLDTVRAKACVLSFTAVMIQLEGKLDAHQNINGEQCAARAERLMPYILSEANPESLQICAMLVSPLPPKLPV